MLSKHSTTTPRRPLPPAKARKSHSVNFAGIPPPPPYAPPLDEVLLDSPIPVTAQLINAASKGTGTEGIGLPGTPVLDDWMNERSRDELSDLLLRADGLIKSRETELSMTSALCKSLYSDNVTLKGKHESLLARLPGTRASTPSDSRPSSPPPLGSSLSAVAVAFPASPEQELPQTTSIMNRIKRARRISVTPAELALLSDQNAELIEKLEKLETESLKADQAGKRKLRKLEQEIQTLRDELDQTHARGAELEEQAKAAEAAVTVQKRKEACEARRQAAKDRSLPASDDSVDGIRDFAPPSGVSRPSPIRQSVSRSSNLSGSSSTGSSEYSVERALANLSFEDDDADPQSYFPTPPGSAREVPPAEYAIVSQLLFKIRELEETNTQIKEQQTATEERMRAAQWDAESIRRVYDCLDDQDVDLEIQEEDETPSERSSDALQVPSNPNGIIRFSSLRRTIVGDMSRLMTSDSTVFADGISGEMQSTVREGLAKAAMSSKARKTVVGLFDPEPDRSLESVGRTPHPTLKASPSFQNAELGELSWSPSMGDVAPPSPALSAVPFPMDRRTLGSELGSEFGDGWRGVNHHLRTNSLLDLAAMTSSPASPSESTVALPASTVDEEQTPTATAAEWTIMDPSTPPRRPDLQLTIQPPTPSPDKLLSPAYVRQFRLSQTVRARTNRWVEGRVMPSSSQESLREKVIRTQKSASTLGRRSAGSLLSRPSAAIAETFDNAIGQVRRVASRGSFAPLGLGSASSQGSSSATVRRADEDHDEQVHHEADLSVSIRQDTSVADPLGGNREGVVGVVVYAWLWLQFVIVIMLFLWAMAKRGPKVVLEAERRHAHRATGRRG